jgi:aminopeptidase N
MLKTIHGLIKDHSDKKPLALNQDFLDVYAVNLANATEGDQAFAARMLALPANNIVIQGLKTVDPDAVEAATEFLRTKLAETFMSDLERIYKETASPAGEIYNVDPAQVGRRELHNTSLSFLRALATPEVSAVAEQQYKQSANMTEKLAGLSVLSRMAGDAGATALEEFYQQYKDNPNIVNKWLRLQAAIESGDVIGRLEQLMKHEAFDMTNPNKVSAVVGGFVGGNPTAFHKKDGSGYKFVADVVIELNAVNPKTGARLVTMLTQFKRYDEERQALMVAELKRIMETPNLGTSIRELAGQALATAEKKPKDSAGPKPGQAAKPE